MDIAIPSAALDIPAESPHLPVVAGDLVSGVLAALEVETGSVARAGAADEGHVIVGLVTSKYSQLVMFLGGQDEQT